MKTRWISLGVVIGLGLALTLGFAFGSGRATPLGIGRATVTNADPGDWWTAMEAMHDSPAMRQMHEQMPANLQQQCDAMHEQMEQWTKSGDAGNFGPGMMGGNWSPQSGSAGSSGGMMGGSSGGMMGW